MSGRSSSPRSTPPSSLSIVAGAGVGLVIVAVAGSLGCGANINAVYEGDVRFEHCMALDSRPDVKPTLRRSCWQEWSRFYTYGQTRDRVNHAVMREHQLRRASDFDEGAWEAPVHTAVAAPEPTSATAPPPITASTAPSPTASGSAAVEIALSPAASASAAANAPPGVASASAPTKSSCAAACRAARATCEQGCHGPACEQVCAERYDRCVERCP